MAAWIWVGYLIAMWLIDQIIYLHKPADSVWWYYGINLLPALFFLLITYLPWKPDLPAAVAFLLIALISLAPMLLQHLLNLRLPEAPLSNLEGMVIRQLPILFIGLILTTWNGSLGTVLAYSLLINGFELVLSSAINHMDPGRLGVFFFLILVRTVCFLVIGFILQRLISILRAQQASLEQANRQLGHYASTLETLTISRERNRLSRELHDTVVHTLSGLAVQLETVKAYLFANPDTASAVLDQALQSTRSGLDDTRRALKELRASPLDDLGFILAIRQLLDQAANRARLIVDARLPDNLTGLPPDVEQSIYRITQEALENVIHHANASHLTFDLSQKNGELNILIQDDGIGFNPEGMIAQGHFGLAGMKERARLLGGDIQITSKINHGTSIQLTIKGISI
jgi:NarL family two-component system sensor histidine kinase YdfH